MRVECRFVHRFPRAAVAVLASVLVLVLLLPSFHEPATGAVQVTREVVASGLNWPVAFAFAPDGRILFNERFTGRIREIVNGNVSSGALGNVTVLTSGEQGLLGLALDPDFSGTPWAYVYHTYFNASLGRAANRVVRMYVGPSILPSQVLLDPIPAGAIHNGGIVRFASDGTLFITTGDAANSANSQDNNSLAGKVLRINRDGTILANNPIPGSPVYSLGHRNMFGLAFHPATDTPYVSENGPSSDDEINVIEPGRNYGWPIVLGVANDPRFVDPILVFPNVIAPTGVAFYTGYLDAWRHSLFLGDWNRGVLQRISLGGPDDRQVLGTETIDTIGGNGILDVEMGPDGYVYYSTPDAIYRLRTPPPPAVDGVVDYTAPIAIVLLAVAAVGFIVIVWFAGRGRRPRA